MEEIKKQITERMNKLSIEQMGKLVISNLELTASYQILLDQYNILKNEIQQLKKKGENEDKIDVV